MELEQSLVRNFFKLLLQVSCYVGFLIQIILLAVEEIKPSQTETSLNEIRLEDIEFPVVFKLCFKDNMDLDKLRDSGYETIFRYFEGKSKFNNSTYGWAGHEKDGNIGKGVEG